MPLVVIVTSCNNHPNGYPTAEFMDQKLTPLELARQTLIKLSKDQTPATPDNYRRVYDDIAGVKSIDVASTLQITLEKVLKELGEDRPKYAVTANRIAALIEKHDALNLETQLRSLFPSDDSKSEGANWGVLLRYLLKQLDVNHTGLTLSRKKKPSIESSSTSLTTRIN